MSLFDRLLDSLVTPTPAAPVAASAPTSGPRGSCKAINAETGRQCALLAGHTTAHRHGSTSFTRVAEPGATSFTRRDALDRAAAASSQSNFSPPE